MKTSSDSDSLKVVGLNKMLRLVMSAIFVIGSVAPARAQAVMALPVVDHNVSPKLFGLTIHPENPLQFEFFIDKNENDISSSESFQKASQGLIADFFAALAVSDDQMWVNLSPSEPDRIIPAALGKTELGYGMLAQDYVLKQMTASLLNPDGEQGRVFWEKFYRVCAESGQSPEGMKDLLHRVWIVPQSADIAVRGLSVFVVGSRLKVLMDDERNGTPSTQSQAIKDLLKSHLIPLLEREVNEGEAFLPLRRMYDAVILAVWYKTRLSRGPLHEAFVDQAKVNGLGDIQESQWRSLYDQYVKLFRDGAYNTIKEEYDASAQTTTVREYVTGGLDLASLNTTINANVGVQNLNHFFDGLDHPQTVTTLLEKPGAAEIANAAMMAVSNWTPAYPAQRLPLSESPKSLKNLTIAVSLADIGAQLDAQGNLIYKDGFAKAKDVIAELAASGVGTVYLYGGLYKMSEASRMLHEKPRAPSDIIQPDENTIIVAGYDTKRKKMSLMSGAMELKDHFGNAFSVDSMAIINPLMSDHPEDVEQRELWRNLKDLVAYAKTKGVDVMLDFIPWLSPDAINEKNYQWTKYREVPSEKQSPEAVKKFLKERQNWGYFAKKITEKGKSRWILIRHFYGGDNKDQVYLDARLPEVQKYYVDSFKRLIDAGASGARVDLPHWLFLDSLAKSEEFGNPGSGQAMEDEPWFKIMTAIKEYAAQKNKNFSLRMESYSETDYRKFMAMANAVGIKVDVYDESPAKKAYPDFVYRSLPLQEFIDNVFQRYLFNALQHGDTTHIPFFSNFDIPSLADMGGPRDAVTLLQIVVAYFGVPTMIDLREWTRQSGHIISIPGGVHDGVITHSLVNRYEFQERMRPGGLETILRNSPYNEFLKTLQALGPNATELIFQQHPDYPWYFMDYVRPVDRQDFVTIGWQDPNNKREMDLLIVRMDKDVDRVREVDLKLPQSLADLWKHDQLRVSIPSGRDSLLLKVVLENDGDINIFEPFVYEKSLSPEKLTATLESFNNRPAEFWALMSRIKSGVLSVDPDVHQTMEQFEKMHLTPNDIGRMKMQNYLETADQKWGAHPVKFRGETVGTYFSVVAPNAQEVSVAGDFNQFDPLKHPLTFDPVAQTWSGFVVGAKEGDAYQFHIVDNKGKVSVKADPYARKADLSTGRSVIVNLEYEWSSQEADWKKELTQKQALDAPLSIYQVHLGSWRKKSDDAGGYQWKNYREIAQELAAYVKEMNFTHVQIMPPMEHKDYNSLGRMTDFLYAPTSRYGTPQDFMYLVDYLHQNGIGVILEWNPAYFPDGAGGLNRFDGTQLYAREGSVGVPRALGYDFSRKEVRSLLISNALYWLRNYHVDGLYIQGADAIVGDSRKNPTSNQGLAFLRDLNILIGRQFPGVLVFREGLGSNDFEDLYSGRADFLRKWNPAWTEKVLDYFRWKKGYGPFFKHFLSGVSVVDQFSNNFVFPLSSRFLVGGQGLLGQMDGASRHEKMNTMKLLIAYMMTAPGNKLLFMGEEFGQGQWDVSHSIDWHLLEEKDADSLALKAFTAEMNRLYRDEESLNDLDFHHYGIEWVFKGDQEGVMIFMRRGLDPRETVMVAFNFSDRDFESFEFGVPWSGEWQEIFNSDDVVYGGQGRTSGQPFVARSNGGRKPMHGQDYSINARFPAKSVMMFKGIRSNGMSVKVQNVQRGYTFQGDLIRQAERTYKAEVSGVIEGSTEKVYKEGKEVVIRIIADSEDPNPQKPRKVFVYSNNNLDQEWVFETATFVKNLPGRAVYEFRCKAERDFEYTAAFEVGDKKNRQKIWVEKPDGKNYKILTHRAFKGETVFIASEFAKLVKEGGQGDVAYELPLALANFRRERLKMKGDDVGISLIMPYYKNVAAKYAGYNFEEVDRFDVPVSYRTVRVVVKTAIIDGIRVYILDTDDQEIFTEPYANSRDEFKDSVVLSRASLELLARLGKPIDMVNYADHHTGLVPFFMRTIYKDFFAKTGSLLTVHNMKYQGSYDPNRMGEIGLDGLFWEDVIFDHRINMMGAALNAMIKFGHGRDGFNTVSQTHLGEIMPTLFGGKELLGGVRHKKGMQNGIDLDLWNPDTDPAVKFHYDIERDGIEKVREARRNNKAYVQQMLSKDGDKSPFKLQSVDNVHGSLEVDPDRLMIANVGRVVDQKQFDIVAQIVENMIDGRRERVPFDLVQIGPGDNATANKFKELAWRAAQAGIDMRICFINEFTGGGIGARIVFSAADITIMPSDTEPGGLVQLQAMRYGTVPIVRATGGLKDTVFELGDFWNGFVFEGELRKDPAERGSSEDNRIRDRNAQELYEAFARAILVYQDKNSDQWKKIQENGMRMDTGWEAAIWAYMDIYNNLKQEADRAMVASLPDNASVAPGGVDFSSKYLKMNESSKIQVDWAEIDSGISADLSTSEGLVPVISGVAPFDRSVFQR